MVVLWDVDVDFPARFEVGGGEFGRLVVAFGAPGDVVGVAEGVDVENVDVGWGQEEILDERCEEVPRVEEEEGYDEPEDIGGDKGEDEVAEELILEYLDEFEFRLLSLDLDRSDCYVDGGEYQVEHDEHPKVDHGHVEFVAALRAVTEGKDEAGE